MSNINSHILKISGGAELSSDLDPSKTLIIKNTEIDIYAVEKSSNEDGTFDIKYKGKITSAIDYEQAGKIMRGADKKGKSRKLRGAIYWLGQEEQVEDQEVFYAIVMDKLIANLPEVWEIVKGR